MSRSAWFVFVLATACGERPAGTASVLVSGLRQPSSLVFDGTWFRFANGDELVQVGLDGGALDVIATGQPQVQVMTLAGGRLYWAGERGIMELKLDGGAPAVLVADAGTRVSALGVLGESILWSVDDLSQASASGGPARQLSMNGGPIAFDARALFWVDGVAGVFEFDGTAVRQRAASSELDPSCIAIDETFVYWGTVWGAIYRVPRAGGSVETVVTGEAHLSGLALDGETVYWITASEHSGTIRRKRVGQDPELFIGGDADPRSLVVTERGLVWLDQTQGALLHAPR